MTGAWLLSLAVSLALTLAAELLYALALKKRGRALAFVALSNVLTNPLAVLSALLWRHYALPGYGVFLAAAELAAVWAEGFIYKTSRTGFARPYRFSLGANALSFALGELLQIIL